MYSEALNIRRLMLGEVFIMESELVTTSTSFLIDSKTTEELLVKETEIDETANDSGDGGSKMSSRHSGTPSGSRSPKKNRNSRAVHSSEENLLRTLQEKITRVEELEEEKERLSRRLADQEEHRLYLDEIVDSRQLEIEAVEEKLKQTIKDADLKSRAAEARRNKEIIELERKLKVSEREFKKGAEELQKELNQAKSRLRRKEEELKQQQARVQNVATQLSSAQDHIFRMQPRRNLITETEANEQFENLFNTVQGWVDSRLERILIELDEDKLKERPCPYERAKRLLTFTQLRAREDFGSNRTDEYHVIAVIMLYLCHQIFNKDFYCPLDVQKDPAGTEDQTLSIIRRIENAMGNTDRGEFPMAERQPSALTSHQDQETCREWRYEALTALVCQPEFKERRADLDRTLTEDLLQLLSILLPADHDPQEMRESIGRNIIRPALDLAHRLQLATDLYTVRWSAYNNDVRSGPIDEMRCDFTYFSCFNLLEGGKSVKSTPDPEQELSLHITYLFDICPGLYCEAFQDGVLTGHPNPVTKPKVLVAASLGERKLANPGPTIFQWLEHGMKNPVPAASVAPEPPKKETKFKSKKWGFGKSHKADRA